MLELITALLLSAFPQCQAEDDTSCVWIDPSDPQVVVNGPDDGIGPAYSIVIEVRQDQRQAPEPRPTLPHFPPQN